MTAPTIKAQLLQERLGQDLDEWVTAGRQDGRSWRVLAAQVSRLTGHTVTHQSLCNWYGERGEAAS